MSAIEGTAPKRSITVSEQHGLFTVTDSLGNASISRTLPGALLKHAVVAHKEGQVLVSDLNTTANVLANLLPEGRGE